MLIPCSNIPTPPIVDVYHKGNKLQLKGYDLPDEYFAPIFLDF